MNDKNSKEIKSFNSDKAGLKIEKYLTTKLSDQELLGVVGGTISYFDENDGIAEL